MKDNIYNRFFAKVKGPMLAVLIDPDKYSPEMPVILSDKNNSPDFILVGGSHVSASTDECILDIKQKTGLPVLLFPGNPSQLSVHADAVLMLMLLSGRNPEYLIGHHVASAPLIKKRDTETISTGYILVGNHTGSSVCKISQTVPIPSRETDLVIATSLAGEIIGNKIIYLEAGSGAEQPLDADIISEVRKNVSVILFSGGGIKSAAVATSHWKAGANVVVVGTAFENDPGIVKEFVEAQKKLQYLF